MVRCLSLSGQWQAGGGEHLAAVVGSVPRRAASCGDACGLRPTPPVAAAPGEEEGKAKLDDESAPGEENATLAENEGAGESISTAEEDAAARKEIVAGVVRARTACTHASLSVIAWTFSCMQETEAEHTLPPAHADVPVSEDYVDLNDVQAFIHSSPEDASDVNRSISATINRTTARTEAA